MKVLLDEHYAPAIAVRLRAGECDAVTVQDLEATGLDDEALLELARSEGRVLVTNNVRDFASIAQRWMASGTTHHGIVFTSDHSYPRNAAATARISSALLDLHRAWPGEDALIDQTRWL